jgi:hypothetical protein
VEGIAQVPRLIRQLYAIAGGLEAHFPGGRFTPDGHLVGSLGGILAALHDGHTLLPASSEGHGALAEDDCLVQVKATQKITVGLRGEPEHRLVLRILPDGRSEELYNGPGELAWDSAGKRQEIGQRPICVSRLTGLMSNVPGSDRLPRVTK